MQSEYLDIIKPISPILGELPSGEWFTDAGIRREGRGWVAPSEAGYTKSH